MLLMEPLTTDYSKKVVAIAPMLDITNIYFRYLARLLTKKAILYTEMISSSAVIMNE